MAILRNKCFILSLLIVLGIGFEFWTGSRYPALDQKALMAGTAGLEPLGFDTVFVINNDDPAYLKVLKGTVNWGKTNQRGMTFGILFAAALLTMISLFKRKSFDGAFSNSALGVLIGTPLGVCVNCAAPIAKGLHSSGLRLETTIAAMISSPTMNVIVLAMVFSLFPLYMATLKVAATLFFLLLCIPLLSKYFFKEEVSLTAQRAIANANPTEAKHMALDANAPTDEEEQQWGKAIVWTLKAFPRNLWYIVKMTLPLMVLAGFLGSLAVTVLPLDQIANLLPGGSKLMLLAGMFLAALIGVFFPVPITFDVIIVSVLMAAGLPVMYAMVLLFTLGIYSVYSYMIVAQSMSRKVGITFWVAIAAVGVGTGVIAHEYNQWDSKRQNEFMLASWGSVEAPVEITYEQTPAGLPAADVLADLNSTALDMAPTGISADGISVSYRDLPVPATGADGLSFTRIAGVELGIDQPYQFSLLNWAQPFSEFGGVASGDVQNDGWPDLVVSSKTGVYLYVNKAGTYVQQAIDVPALQNEFVVNAALVDMDNDGWLDLVFSTYRNGSHIVYNEGGQFLEANRVELPNREGAWVSTALAFGDLNEDGLLDVVVGNWTLGARLNKLWVGRESSRNVVLINTGDGFTMTDLPGPDGETLTAMISDINNDGHLDAAVGNDFEAPDIYYLGDGTGALRNITASDGIVPISSYLTMSIASADINNDLQMDIYVGNVSGTDNSIMTDLEDICEDTRDTALFDRCAEVRRTQRLVNTSIVQHSPMRCAALGEPELVKQCVGLHIYNREWVQEDEAGCKRLAGKFLELSTICEEFYGQPREPLNNLNANEVPQGARRANVMLLSQGDSFVDQALEYNVREAGWVWNAKFADLDQDGWQDLYAVNGYFTDSINSGRESNHMFRNNGGQGFIDETASSGMTFTAESSSYTYVDFDNDGDLDVIVREALGPIWVYRNELGAGNGVSFELDDQLGNRSGVGSKLIAHYAGGSQMREVQAGGGFSSYDAPVVHFGLGDHKDVERIEVRWSTGEVTELQGPFTAGRRYRIARGE